MASHINATIHASDHPHTYAPTARVDSSPMTQDAAATLSMAEKVPSELYISEKWDRCLER